MNIMIVHIFLQIVLEMLPVSSSGHVTLFLHLLCGSQNAQQVLIAHHALDFLLHGVSVVMIGLYFFKQWFRYLIDFFKWHKDAVHIVLFCIVADCITALFYGFFIYTQTTFFQLWLGFLITGLLLLVSSLIQHEKEQPVSLKAGLVVGITQGLALLPGISRFGSTFVVGRFLGFSSMQSFQYSFLIAWPLMFAAWVKGSYDLFSTQEITQLLSGDIVLSMVIATVISWYCLQQIAKIIEKKQVHYLAWWLFLVAFVAFFTVKV